LNINAGEHRRDNHNEQPRETGQHKGTQDEEKQNKKHNTICVEHLYAQTQIS
jgi:hypothetical protein